MGETCHAAESKPTIDKAEYGLIVGALVRYGVRGPDLHDDAQEVCCIALSAPFTGGSFRGWLWVIARNVARRRSKKVKTAPMELLVDCADPSPTAEEQLLQHEAEMLKQSLFQRLTESIRPERREIFLDHFYGLTIAELVEVHKLAEGTIKSRLRLAREDLDAAVARYRTHQKRLGAIALPFTLDALIAGEQARVARVIEPIVDKLISQQNSHEGRAISSAPSVPPPAADPGPALPSRLPLKQLFDAGRWISGGIIGAAVATLALSPRPAAEWLLKWPAVPVLSLPSGGTTSSSSTGTGTAAVPSPSTSTKTSPPKKKEGTLKEALDLLRAAENAVMRHNLAEAALWVRQYDEQFPSNPVPTARQALAEALSH